MAAILSDIIVNENLELLRIIIWLEKWMFYLISLDHTKLPT